MNLFSKMGIGLMTLAFVVGLDVNAETNVKPADVQLAILLDSSGSMSGLINQTKTQLWKVVNELTKARKHGLLPDLKVSVYQHGMAGFAAEGFIQRLTPLTVDLDIVSEKLFDITTTGSNEFTGQAIEKAALSEQWSQDGDAYKAIFIAGNETMEQGPVDFRDAIRTAASKGLIVNTIHAGEEAVGIQGFWRAAADLGGGNFVNINMNYNRPHIPSPYDQEILDLNNKLNDTYLYYGKDGKEAKDRQAREDANAGDNLLDRGASKASGYYRNSSWDLIDGIDEKQVKLEDIPDEELPEELRGKTLQYKLDFIEGMRQKRREIQKQIQALYRLREEFVEKKLEEMGEDNANTVGKALIANLRQQLTQRGFTFEK